MLGNFRYNFISLGWYIKGCWEDFSFVDRFFFDLGIIGIKILLVLFLGGIMIYYSIYIYLVVVYFLFYSDFFLGVLFLVRFFLLLFYLKWNFYYSLLIFIVFFL